MVKKRGLGKTLDALLAYTSNPSVDTKNTADKDSEPQEKLASISITEIQRGKYQPRREMDSDALEELASSIRTQGIIQPLILRPFGEKYEIVAGERRFRAAHLAGLTHVPAIIREIPDEAAMAVALIENIQREDLNPVEEAIALHRLIDEFGMTHLELAESVGKSRASVTNLLRLLGLPEQVKTMLERGKLEMGHARALITLPPDLQLKATEMIVDRQLSVRETESLVRRLQVPTPKRSLKPLDPDVRALQETLSRQLKMRVAIQCNAKGKGKVVIHYQTLTELDKLLEQIQAEA